MAAKSTFLTGVLTGALAGLILLAAPSVAAAAVVSLVGDRDCFGQGGTCPDGPTTDFTYFQEASDPYFTDKLAAFKNPTYSHTYDLAGAMPESAFLEIRTSALADGRGPWNVFFNGEQVGVFAVQAREIVLTYIFSIALDLLTGNDQILLAINDPDANDGHMIDYSALTIETRVSAVPVPAALPLFLSALALLGFFIWRRKGRRAQP